MNDHRDDLPSPAGWDIWMPLDSDQEDMLREAYEREQAELLRRDEQTVGCNDER